MSRKDYGLMDQDNYRPVSITVRPYLGNSSEAACDYLGKKELIEKEVNAIFQGIVNYYK